MNTILQLLTDPENQPHQYVGDKEALRQALEAQAITDRDNSTIKDPNITDKEKQTVDVEENFDCQELLKVIDKAWYGYGNAKESVVHIVKESFAITPPSEGA